MLHRSLGHRAPLLWLVLPLMVGIAAGRMLAPPAPLWLLMPALLLAGVAAIAAWRESVAFAPALLLSMILAGAASYVLHHPRLLDWDWLPPREAQVSLRIDRRFEVDDPGRAVGLATIQRADSPLGELVGQRVYFSLTSATRQATIRSAIVSATGVIAALPRDPPPHSFEAYLASSGINYRFTRGRVLAEEQPASAYRRFCNRQSGRFADLLAFDVGQKRPALVGVFRAMLLGRQHELSDQQTELFRQSGTMHVFSISGLHIAVIAAGLHALVMLLHLPRPLQFALGLSALWLYVDITGAAPSAIRAFVMVALVEASLVLRVPRNPLSALTASALLVLLAAPLQVFSASFQMSYGIVAALLLLGLPLAEAAQERLAWFRDLPAPTWSWQHHALAAAWRATLTALSIGVAASLVSALSSIAFFGLFTPGALLANLWLIPASTGVILAGFVSLVAGLGGFLTGVSLANHAAVLLLWAIDAGVRGSVTMPAGWFQASFRAPWVGSAALALLLAVMAVGYAQRWQGWTRGYWMPFAVVAATLVFGTRFG